MTREGREHLTDPEPITKPQAEALAGILHQLRPEWGIPSMVTLIGHNKDHPATFQRLTVAAVHAATRTRADGTPVADTPKVIYQPGRHWDHPVGETPAHQPAGPNCEDHPTFQAHSCRCCWADIKAGLRPENALGKHHEESQEAS